MLGRILDPLSDFSVAVKTWFEQRFAQPTLAQTLGFPPIHSGQSTLLLAPTGSGKTLTAFLSSLDRLMTGPDRAGLRVLYVSPLKALAVDIEQNLRAPIDGIVKTAANLGLTVHAPDIALRTGDTTAKERAAFLRRGADILITTPESLYLLLTSQAAKHFTNLETVIIDEIHSLLPTKRGAHLFLTLERLEALRTSSRPLQRIGLSATQRPVSEAARLLGGGFVPTAHSEFEPRPITVVDARQPPHLDVLVRGVSRSVSVSKDTRSAWPDIHAPLLDLIYAHRSTLIFVNSRRLAERLAQAVNELAQTELVLAHHGSLAKDRRTLIEAALKSGTLRALVATSSLELGIDMGSIDLVVQVDAPPSVASGLQRIGRAGHQVGAVSEGVLFPKHRGDLLPTAAVVRGMLEGEVEATTYPRNPLDVLAQQIVATVCTAAVSADDLYALCKRAAPFADLPRSAFESALDMLSGRYPSDEFSELRPRITWDRDLGFLTARASAKRVAIVGAGTIADRGLYGVFLSNSERPVRVGELDEEMVFESRVGEVFLLGASSWRIDAITHDRVLVSPAPGQPGTMPFWRGTGPGRPAELGRRIGELTRELLALSPKAASVLLSERHGFDEIASNELTRYLEEQREATRVVPSDRTLVVERYPDEISGFRVCILSPWGQRVHAPWALALTLLFRNRSNLNIDAVWSDDGIVFRLPESAEKLTLEALVGAPEALEELVVTALSSSALFAAHFRENAGRALLLPKRDPRRRQPLWAQRKRSADLLRVASRFPDFPILRETYRECLSEVFDLKALSDLFARIRRREVELSFVESQHPSPFANSIVFSYVGNFLYEKDAPLEERKAQALALAQSDLRELLGEAALRELLSPEVIYDVVQRIQRRTAAKLRHADDLHDLLLVLGDQSEPELETRAESAKQLAVMLEELILARRVFPLTISSQIRFIASEDAGRFRDALGAVLPKTVPAAFLESTPNPLDELLARYARTHGPFEPSAPATRYGLENAQVVATLERLERSSRVVCGEFLPGRSGSEWCDRDVLRQLRQLSLARLRKAIEPVPTSAYVFHLLGWQSVLEPSRAIDALETAIDQLQGYPILASVFTDQVLKARVMGFFPGMLDAILATGSVTWVGVEPLGTSDGKIALYRTEELTKLAPLPNPVPGLLAERLRAELAPGGAFFFAELLHRVGGFPPDLLKTIWDMVWASEVTNDTLLPLRSLRVEAQSRGGRPAPRARRPSLPGSEGRWSLVRRDNPASPTEQLTARANLLLERYGVVCREIVNADYLGNFSELHPVYQALENAGRLRRGYFVKDLGAVQYAHAHAFERLRKPESRPTHPLILSAVDPANPFGASLPWPDTEPRPQRVAGSTVILYQHRLLAYLARGDRALTTFLEPEGSKRDEDLNQLLQALKQYALSTNSPLLLIETLDHVPANSSVLTQDFCAAGFTRSTKGLSWFSHRALPVEPSKETDSS